MSQTKIWKGHNACLKYVRKHFTESFKKPHCENIEARKSNTFERSTTAVAVVDHYLRKTAHKFESFKCV